MEEDSVTTSTPYVKKEGVDFSHQLWPEVIKPMLTGAADILHVTKNKETHMEITHFHQK